MINSIKHFEEESISIFEKLEDDFFKHPEKMAEYIKSITKELHKIGILMIQESLEQMNQQLKDSGKRTTGWYVEKDSRKQLVTSLGTVNFTKTLFKNRETGKREYLLDRVLGLEKHERITEDAVEKMLEEAVQTSYRRGGEESCLEGNVSKQTVKTKLHSLKFPKTINEPEMKKEVEYLYLEADEDHVSLQFREHKGDLSESGNGGKKNCLITKLVYVHEGIEREAPKSKRYKLVNPHYFCRVCDGKENEAFWDEIYEYINSHYQLEKVKKIYLNADGGRWIGTARTRIKGLTYVLDEFHLQKYLIRLSSHMKDSTDDAYKELRRAIRRGTKADFFEIVERLKNALPEESVETGTRRLEQSRDYILENWGAARMRLMHKDGVIGSSTEGHVSHVLSSRMSSRPMGWSRKGAGKMAQLRAYYYNGGDMLNLVRYQKAELPKAAGYEQEKLLPAQIFRSEKNKHGILGKYLETITHSVSLNTKKKIYFNEHIWGL